MSQSITSNEGRIPSNSDLAQTTSSISQPNWLRRLVNGTPTFVTFALLAIVLWYGRASHWRMPKFSSMTGGEAAAPADWCIEHSVPDSICVQCKPELFARPKSIGFCKVHGVADCVTCHPNLAQVNEKPEMPKYDTAAAITVVERPKNNSMSTLHKSLVQFASRDAVDRAGIEPEIVGERAMTESISANGEVTFDPTRVAHLSTKLPGNVAVVCKFVGDHVEAGDVLALIDSSQVGQAKSQLVQSVVQLQLRQRTVARLERGKSAVSTSSLDEAKSELRESQVAAMSARQALSNLGLNVPQTIEGNDADALADQIRFLGIPSDIVEKLPEGLATANLLPIRATYSGVVMLSDVVAGEVVDSSKPLFVVADPSKLWLTLAVRSEDARYIHTGLPVEFQPDGGAPPVTGKVTWISPTVNDQTRTLSVRVILDELKTPLRDHTFGKGQVILRREDNAIVVPRTALQATSDAYFVFVRDKNYFDENAPKVFHVRQVRLGARDDRYVELLAGALPGEVVVGKGSNVLLAQLLKSNLGAGCGCCPH